MTTRSLHLVPLPTLAPALEGESLEDYEKRNAPSILVTLDGIIDRLDGLLQELVDLKARLFA